MIANSQKHAMEMAARGDKLHIEAMEAMRQQHANMDLEAVKQWMEKFQKEFDTHPEDKMNRRFQALLL